MGVRYSPILYLGRTFESEEDALEFYQKHFELSDDDLKAIKADGFGEWMYGHHNLSFERTSYYTNDCDCILGFNLAPYVKYPDTFTSAVQDSVEDWRVMFGDEPYNIIHDIRIS